MIWTVLWMISSAAYASELDLSSAPAAAVGSSTVSVSTQALQAAATSTISISTQPAAPALSTATVRPAHAGTFHIALIEDTEASIHLPLLPALERTLQESQGSVEDVWTRPCNYAAGDYRYRVPGWAVAAGSTRSAVAFETDTEVVLIAPELPDLIETLRKKAAAPSTFNGRWGVSISSKPVFMTQSVQEDGDSIMTAVMKPDKNASRRWHSTAMTYYRILWKGRRATVAFIGKPYGGLGRLAAAIENEKRAGNLIGVARGGLFGLPFSERSGRALMETLRSIGLEYSAVSDDELRHWREIDAYRVQTGTSGIQLISANIVYSTAPEKTVLPSHKIVHLGDLRIAVTALTPKSAAGYLSDAGLANAEILDPAQALPKIADLREQADAVVLITAEDDIGRIRADARGVDIIAAEDVATLSLGHRPDVRVEHHRRAPFEPPLLTVHSYEATLTVVDADLAAYRGESDWTVRERHVDLDDRIGVARGYREFDPNQYGINFSTEPPLIPSEEKVFGGEQSPRERRSLNAAEFWTLAASLLREETKSEIAFLPVSSLRVQPPGDTPESVVRLWFAAEEPVEIVMMKGSDLRPLIARAKDQQSRERRGLPPGPPPRFVAAGVNEKDQIDHAPIEDAAVYRAVFSRELAEALKLQQPQKNSGRTVDDIVLKSLRERKGSDYEAYRAWMNGQSILDRGLWRINFRDVGLNLQNTKVVRDNAFDQVPSSRIQGFDEFLIGAVFETDADYLKGANKWSNSLEMEYARSRLAPRDQPPVVNLTANRISYLTTETRRAGSIFADWLARSWGPSIGFQAENQFEAPPGLKRRQTYSAYPGVEFYDGTYVQKLELTGNVRRDYSRDPPNNQYGLHARTLLSHQFTSWGEVPLTLQGEFYANYFVLTHSDQPQDLRLEGEANLKLRVPVRRYLSIAPFIDLYWFGLKTQPLWGYSAITGVTVGFSRIWKPQYE